MPSEFDSRLYLSSLLKRASVLYVEAGTEKGNSVGKFFAITETEQGLEEITFDIYRVMKNIKPCSPTSYYSEQLCRRVNYLATKHPETFVRDLSYQLFCDWRKIRFYSLPRAKI